jgi:hypothetical protein
MKPHKQTVYLPVKVEDANGNYIPDRSLLLVKEQGEMDKYWIDLVSQKQGYFFTPEQLNEYTQKVIKQALETAAENAQTIDTYKTRWSGLNKEGFVEKDVYRESITNTFEETFKKFEV